MTLRTLILRSLRFHARSHLGVLLGATLGSAILIGALLVGDSVRGSLRDMALARLGRIHFALQAGDRLVSEFSHDFAPGGSSSGPLGEGIPFEAAPLLQLGASAMTPDGSGRANRVWVYGLDEAIVHFGADARLASISSDAVMLNRALAAQLGAKVGDMVVLRVSKPSAFVKDAAIAKRDDSSFAMRLRVRAIVDQGGLGNFSLHSNQVVPLNAFVSLRALQIAAGTLYKANLLLAAEVDHPSWPPDGFSSLRHLSLESVNQRLEVNFTLEDAQLEVSELRSPSPFRGGAAAPVAPELDPAGNPIPLQITPVPPNEPTHQLTSPRVFLDPPAIRAALAADTNARPILTYLVNLIQAGERATPYSMVTAAGTPFVPADLRDDEIVINQWLAEDLKVGPGAELALTYFRPDSGAQLVEATNRFHVRSVVPMKLPWVDRNLMPEFPGIASAEKVGNWEAGFPLKHKVRKADDEYWKALRGTPKAFVSLSAGRKMWASRFGDTTAITFHLRASAPVLDAAGNPVNDTSTNRVTVLKTKEELEQAILARLKPADFGLVFQPVREQALKASREGQDFGGLFIGFSFFLIVAACVLVALLFQFGVEQRAKEVGTLLALGFTPKQVRRLLLGEGAGLAVLGAALGAVGAVWYARAMLHGLSTVWRDAVGTSDLRFHAEPATLAGGFVGAVAVAVFSLWLALRKQVRQPARVLLAGGGEEGLGSGVSGLGKGARAVEGTLLSPIPAGQHGEGGAAHGGQECPPHGTNGSGPRPKSLLLGLGSLALAIALLGWALATGQTANAGAFFGAGALLLVAALAGTAALLTRLERSEAAAALTVASLGIRNTTRRRSRSLATATMLACGSFMVLSIGVFRLDENANATKRSSGTGGFALLGESTLPVVQDLNTKAGREALGLEEKALEGVSVVPFRVRDGDDASCLNLNRAQKPRLLGVKPELLAERKAFEFAAVIKGLAKEDGWKLLREGARTPTSASATLDSQAAADVGVRAPIPAIADMNSILWAMGKSVGDIIEYPEPDERGRPVRLRLVGAVANSILQGNLIIAEDEFTARFPSEVGYRYFLVDAPTNRVADVSATLTRALRDFGLELTPATRRMAQLNAVQNTYLGTFQILGGLGLLLGSAGLGVVVLRNVLERRGELALLLALGFRAKALRWLVLSEHAALLLLGLLSGVVAAGVAVLPSVLGAGELPVGALALTLGGVLVSGLVWTWLATVSALRGQLLDALRNQ